MRETPCVRPETYRSADAVSWGAARTGGGGRVFLLGNYRVVNHTSFHTGDRNETISARSVAEMQYGHDHTMVTHHCHGTGGCDAVCATPVVPLSPAYPPVDVSAYRLSAAWTARIASISRCSTSASVFGSSSTQIRPARQALSMVTSATTMSSSRSSPV